MGASAVAIKARKMIHSSCRVGSDPQKLCLKRCNSSWGRVGAWPFFSHGFGSENDGCWVPSKRFSAAGILNFWSTPRSPPQRNCSCLVWMKWATLRLLLAAIADDFLENLWCDQAVRFFKGPWSDIMGFEKRLQATCKASWWQLGIYFGSVEFGNFYSEYYKSCALLFWVHMCSHGIQPDGTCPQIDFYLSCFMWSTQISLMIFVSLSGVSCAIQHGRL